LFKRKFLGSEHVTSQLSHLTQNLAKGYNFMKENSNSKVNRNYSRTNTGPSAGAKKLTSNQKNSSSKKVLNASSSKQTPAIESKKTLPYRATRTRDKYTSGSSAKIESL
jgi:hypothetical protein